MSKLGWMIFVLFAVIIGLYPFAYLIFDMRMGLLSTKPPGLLEDSVWRFFFDSHILPGGVALLVGWSQFIRSIRLNHSFVHRLLGRIYLAAVLVSGLSGLSIAFYATGGIIAKVGFIGLAISWLFTTIQAFVLIRNKRVTEHQHWMIRSYALCFAAVTLRLWLPSLEHIFGLDFLTAYRTVAWLCWVPNLIVAEVMIRNLKANIGGAAVRT